jgi:hypothetical protein
VLRIESSDTLQWRRLNLDSVVQSPWLSSSGSTVSVNTRGCVAKKSR